MNKLKNIAFCIMLMCCHSVASAQGGNDDLFAKKLKQKADSCYWKGDFKKAEVYYNKASEAAYRGNNHFLKATLWSDLANIDYGNDNLAAAIRKCQNGLKLLKNNPNDTLDFRISSLLAVYYEQSFKKDSADVFNAHCEKLLEQSAVVRSRDEAVYFYSNQVAFALMYNDFKKADTYFHKALSLSKKSKNHDLGILYNNIAYSYLRQKKYQEAQNYFDLAVNNQNSMNAANEIVLLNLAFCNIQIGTLPAAKKNIDKAWNNYLSNLKNNKLGQNTSFTAQYNFVLANYFEAKKQPDLAFKHHQKVLGIVGQSKNHGDYALRAYESLGRLCESRNEAKEALGYYQKMLVAAHDEFKNMDIYANPDLKNILSELYLFRALTSKSHALQLLYAKTHQLKDLETALKTNELAIKLAEKMRRSYQSSASKLFFAENYYAVYEQAIEQAQQLHNITQQPQYIGAAFDFYERSRAATLSDMVRDASLKPKTIPAAVLAQERTINQQIAGLTIAVKRSDSLSAIEYNTKLANKEIELDRLSRRLEREYPAYYQLKYESLTPSISKIQQQLLDPQTALIQYFMTDKELYILLATKEKTTILTQDIDDVFRKKISDFRANISANPGSKVYGGRLLSASLYNTLIKPIEPLILAKKRLIIVRDAELNYVPFEVLSPNKTDYLLNKFSISYAYSVGLLMNNFSPQKNDNRLAIAPFIKKNDIKKDVFRGDPLVQLPASEQEVKQIGGDIYLEKEATKKRFLEQYRSHGIIHFATHALTNDQDPLRSFIAFYPDGQEYRLFTDELYDLDLGEAKLVVLSACETGAGKLHKGEGVMSLARAFSYAGATTVATTLWNANDETTAYISTQFHEYINDGMSLDEALRQAKLDFLSSKLSRQYDHPYYWANMVLIGNNHAIETGYSAWWWVLGVGLLLLLGWAMWRLKK